MKHRTVPGSILYLYRTVYSTDSVYICCTLQHQATILRQERTRVVRPSDNTVPAAQYSNNTVLRCTIRPISTELLSYWNHPLSACITQYSTMGRRSSTKQGGRCMAWPWCEGRRKIGKSSLSVSHATSKAAAGTV